MKSTVSNLSPAALSKAVNELNEPEDENARLAAINKLREAFQTDHSDLKLVREDDVFFLRFLRAKKFNQEKALVILRNYHAQRLAWPEVFDIVSNPVLIKSVFENGVVFVLDGKAKNGSNVVVMRPGLNECTDVTHLFAGLYLTIDHLLDDEEFQVFGATMLVDLAYFSTEIAKQFLPSVAMKMTKTMQDCMPLRNKCLNFTNEPRIFDAAFAVVQPFIKDKLKKRITFHGKDFSKLYDVIDRSNLPFVFAGTGPEPNFELWKNQIIQEGTAL